MRITSWFSLTLLSCFAFQMFRPLSKSKSKIVHLLQSEVIPERVTLLEELGQGAFGKVHKGVLKELPKSEVFYKPKRERINEVSRETVVAVKVLLGKKIHHIWDRHLNWNGSNVITEPRPDFSARDCGLRLLEMVGHSNLKCLNIFFSTSKVN